MRFHPLLATVECSGQSGDTMRDLLVLSTTTAMYLLFGSSGKEELTYQSLKGFVDYVISDKAYYISTDFCWDAIKKIVDDPDSGVEFSSRGDEGTVIVCTGRIYPDVDILGSFKPEVVQYLLHAAYEWLTQEANDHG